MTRWVALALTVATGFTGLVYEVAWQKYLATLLGSHSEATAAVLGLFLGGLAAGYALFGGVTRRLVARAETAGRPPRLILAYAAVEVAIGLYALAFPALFGAVQRLSFAIPHGATGFGFALDVLLSALLILPPTILMGATIPVLTQALAHSLSDATRFHALVYAFNTAGAFAGALAAGFWLVPRLGLVGTMHAMAGINLAAGAVFGLLGLRARAIVRLDAGPDADTDTRLEGFAAYATAAGLVGFAMMALQTVVIRLGGLSFGSSEYTFAMVVAAFVLCIALGSFAVSLLPRISPLLLVLDLWGLVLVLYLLYGSLEEAPYWVHVLRTLFRDHRAAFLPFHAAGFLAVVAVVGLPVLLSGAALPLLFHQLRREVGDLGRMAGRLYSWNTVGSLAGSLLGGYALLFWLDLHHVYRLAVAALAVAAALLSARFSRAPRSVAVPVLLVPVIGALALRAPWDPALLSMGLFRERQATPASYEGPEAMRERWKLNEIVFYDDDPTTTVTVTETVLNGRLLRSVITNGKPDGNTHFDYTTMSLAGTLPALLAREPRRAFVIGFGTGVTAGELASLDPVREVVVAEISSGVLRAAPLFDFANHGVTESPEVRLVRSDAYRALMRSQGRFDVIVSEPSNPWVTGVEMLFSREFLEVARDRLSPGGVYAQWFHQYETSRESLELVLRTYASVFEEVAVWYTQHMDLLLLGFGDDRHAAGDLARLERRLRRPDFAAALERGGIRSLPGLLAHEILPLGVVRAAELAGPLHTLLHPRLAHAAGRGFFVGDTGALPFTGYGEPARVGARHSLLRRLAARWDGELPEAVRARTASQACAQRSAPCGTFLAAWRRASPDLAELARAERRALGHGNLAGPPLGPGIIDELGRLLPGGSSAPRRAVPFPEAQRASDLYRHFYQHAVPFDPESLLALWKRCRPPPRMPRACLLGLRQARMLLERGGRARDAGRMEPPPGAPANRARYPAP